MWFYFVEFQCFTCYESATTPTGSLGSRASGNGTWPTPPQNPIPSTAETRTETDPDATPLEIWFLWVHKWV